jgi:FhaA, N-terminal domain/FHA domain
VTILREFERRLGGLVEGLFSKAFRSGVQPVELAKRLLKEMDAGKSVGVSEIWAPNRFEFFLSEEDGEHFEQAEAAIAKELRQVVVDNAAERGWDLMGPPQVEFFVDPSYKRGDLTCTASLVEGQEEPAAAEVDASTASATLTIHEDGSQRTAPLRRDSVTIGRLPDCDVVIDDKGASRRHAQLKRKGSVYLLTDLGSTNGTRLNGETVQSRELRDGDKITIGSTVIEFRRT